MRQSGPPRGHDARLDGCTGGTGRRERGCDLGRQRRKAEVPQALRREAPVLDRHLAQGGVDGPAGVRMRRQGSVAAAEHADIGHHRHARLGDVGAAARRRDPLRQHRFSRQRHPQPAGGLIRAMRGHVPRRRGLQGIHLRDRPAPLLPEVGDERNVADEHGKLRGRASDHQRTRRVGTSPGGRAVLQRGRNGQVPWLLGHLWSRPEPDMRARRRRRWRRVRKEHLVPMPVNLARARRRACVALLACLAGVASAQQPKMFPGTVFPGNDLASAPAASPEDCANRCIAEQRCKAFTWIISERRCMLKWNSSTFDGSLNAVSGIIEGRPVSPPPVASAPPAASAPAATCAVPDAPPCAGCSVSCAPGQTPQCTGGTIGADGACTVNSKCRCLQP